MKAKSLTYSQIDKKRRNNKADSCCFYIPDNAEGKRFIASLRKFVNCRYRLRVRPRGLHADSYGGVRPENVTHFGVYLDNANLTKQMWETVRKSREFGENNGYQRGRNEGRAEALKNLTDGLASMASVTWK